MFGDRDTGTESFYWDHLVSLVQTSFISDSKENKKILSVDWGSLDKLHICFLPVYVHLILTETCSVYHPASAWIDGFILHNRNGLCEMTWFEWGCGAGLSRPKCLFSSFLFVFYVCVCVCTPDSQSSVKENKLSIFKMIKNEQKYYIVNVKKK